MSESVTKNTSFYSEDLSYKTNIIFQRGFHESIHQLF